MPNDNGLGAFAAIPDWGNPVSNATDQQLAQIQALSQQAQGGAINGVPIRQSGPGKWLGEAMASTYPWAAGAASRLAEGAGNLLSNGNLGNPASPSYPRPSDAFLGVPAVGAAGRAAAPLAKVSPETGAIAGSGLGGFGVGAGIGAAEAAEAGGRPVARTRQEFDATYNVPRPALRSIDEVAADAKAAYEKSPAYADLIKQSKSKLAGDEADKVAAAARSRYGDTEAAHGKAMADWEKGREAAWGAEQADFNKRLGAFNDQGFWDRNPELKGPAMGVAYALPAMAGAGISVRNAAAGNRVAKDFEKAMAEGNVSKAALLEAEAKAMMSPDKTALEKVGSAAKTGGLMMAPAEVNAIGKAADATFAPEGSGAQKRARAELKDPLGYMAGQVPNALSGAALYGMGKKVGSVAAGDPKAKLSAVMDEGKGARAEALGQQAQQGAKAGSDVRMLNKELAAKEAAGPPPPKTLSDYGREESVAAAAKMGGGQVNLADYMKQSGVNKTEAYRRKDMAVDAGFGTFKDGVFTLTDKGRKAIAAGIPVFGLGAAASQGDGGGS